MIIAATGHRPDKLGGYSDAIAEKLMRLAWGALLSERPEGVISGMALGWDTAVARAAIMLGIPLIAAVPFKGQEHQWPALAQYDYRKLLARAARVEIISLGDYSARAMQRRNEWMVDESNRLLALWDGSSGGTANCVAYAGRKDREVINLWGEWSAR